MAVDTKKLTRDQNGRLHGRCVHILHVYRDFLWKHGGKTHPPDLSEIQHMKSQGPDGVEQAEDGEEEEDAQHSSVPIKVEQAKEGVTKDQEPRMATEEVDAHLRQALLHALAIKIGAQGALETLPISASLLYESYILPSRPVGSSADIKQSSWKKISKFLKTLDKEKLLRVKEVRGDLQVLSVDWKHKSLSSFVPQDTIESTGKGGKGGSGKGKGKGDGAKDSPAGGPSKVGQVRVEYYYKPNHPTSPLFLAQESPKDALYIAPEVKKIMQDYLESHDLVNQRNKR